MATDKVALTTLDIGDNESKVYTNTYNVVACSYNVRKEYDKRICAIDSKASNVQIKMTIVAPESKADLTLYEWYISLIPLSGRVKIDVSNVILGYGDGQYKIIEFNDAYCIGLSEDYDIAMYSRREITVVLQTTDVKLRVDTIES